MDRLTSLAIALFIYPFILAAFMIALVLAIIILVVRKIDAATSED